MPHRNVRNALVTLSVLASARLAAQDAPAALHHSAPPARSGFYTSAGFGWGSADQSCTGSFCSGVPTGTTNGTSGYFGIGGTISRQFRLGFEADVSSVTSNGSMQKLGFFNLMLTYYPKVASNLWLKAGLGYVANTIDWGLTGSVGVGGFSGAVGLGYDMLPTNSEFAVIPYATYSTQFAGGTPNLYSDASFKAHLFQIGVGLGYKH